MRRWWLDRPVRAKGLIVVAVPLIALIGTATASLALQYSQRQERTARDSAFGLISAANQVLTDALNAETGVRGYAATREPLFLSPYRMALARIGADRRALRTAAVAEGGIRQERLVAAAAHRVFRGLGRLRADVRAGAGRTRRAAGLGRRARVRPARRRGAQDTGMNPVHARRPRRARRQQRPTP